MDNDRSKTTTTVTTHEIPLVQASFVEPPDCEFTEFVVIDAYVEQNRRLDLQASCTMTIDGASSPQLQHHDVSSSNTLGAWAAGMVLGLFVMGAGPFVSMAIGIGTAYCSQQESMAGDLARAMGDVALFGNARIAQVQTKHNLLETICKSTLEKAKRCFNAVRKSTKGQTSSKEPT